MFWLPNKLLLPLTDITPLKSPSLNVLFPLTFISLKKSKEPLTSKSLSLIKFVVTLDLISSTSKILPLILPKEVKFSNDTSIKLAFPDWSFSNPIFTSFILPPDPDIFTFPLIFIIPLTLQFFVLIVSIVLTPLTITSPDTSNWAFAFNFPSAIGKRL